VRCPVFPQAMCHRDDRAGETALTVCSFCRSLLNAHHYNLSFQKPKHNQFHIHSGTSVHRVTHSRVPIALVIISPTAFSSSSSPVTRQHSIFESGVRPSITDTNIPIGSSWQPSKMTYFDDALDIYFKSVLLQTQVAEEPQNRKSAPQQGPWRCNPVLRNSASPVPTKYPSRRH
jgi:hypothetical protein